MSFPPTCFRTQSHQLNSLLISNLLSPLPWRFLLDSIPRSSIWEKFLSLPASSRHNSPLGETTVLPGQGVWTGCFQLLTTDSSLCSPHLVSLITHLWGQNSMVISQFLCSLMLLQNLMLGSLHSWPCLLPSPEPSFSISLFPHFLISAPLLLYPYRDCPCGPPTLSSSLHSWPHYSLHSDP